MAQVWSMASTTMIGHIMYQESHRHFEIRQKHGSTQDNTAMCTVLYKLKCTRYTHWTACTVLIRQSGIAPAKHWCCPIHWCWCCLGCGPVGDHATPTDFQQLPTAFQQLPTAFHVSDWVQCWSLWYDILDLWTATDRCNACMYACMHVNVARILLPEICVPWFPCFFAFPQKNALLFAFTFCVYFLAPNFWNWVSGWSFE